MRKARSPRTKNNGHRRQSKAVKRKARLAKMSAETQRWADWSKFGLGGVGAGLVGGGRIKTGVLFMALGIAGNSAFKKLGSITQRRLIASLIGRPRLTEAVCRRIIEPKFEEKLRSLGKIYLPREELLSMRRKILKTRKFDYAEFLADIRPLLKLGYLRTQYRGLTDQSVKVATELMGTKLKYPLSLKGARAAKLAINLITLVEPGKIRFTAAKEIATGVIKQRGPSTESVDVALHLIRAVSRVPIGTKIRSHVLAHKGLAVELKVFPDGTKDLTMGPKKK